MRGVYRPELATVVAETGVVVLRPGEETQTSVTACMSDDSFYDIAKAKVTYRSNNPAVVTVSEDGRVKATGVGAVTVFADVTVEGKTLSGSFPLKVMPDLTPASVTVNGKKIPGFLNEVKAYSYLLKNKAKIPEVAASVAGEGISVEIEQARGIPGTAVIQFIDNITLEKNSYYLNFDVASGSDEFNEVSVGPQWEWIRENPAAVSLSKVAGSLSITSEPGDVSEGTNNARNLLLQSANNDWTIDTKLTASRIPMQPENGGIVAYQDDHNFIKLMFRAVIKTSRGGAPVPGCSRAPST